MPCCTLGILLVVSAITVIVLTILDDEAGLIDAQFRSSLSKILRHALFTVPIDRLRDVC